MAKWLRPWTDNLMGALHVGSIPGTDDFFVPIFFFMMMMVERPAATQASTKRQRRRSGISAANVGASKRLKWESNLCPSASTGSQVQLTTPRLPRLYIHNFKLRGSEYKLY